MKKFKLSLLLNYHIYVKNTTKGVIIIGFIEQFYYGNIEPQSCTTEMLPKLKKQLKNVVAAEEELSQKLNDEEKELLQKYTDLYNEFSCTSSADAFISGFRLSMQLFFDCFAKSD